MGNTKVTFNYGKMNIIMIFNYEGYVEDDIESASEMIINDVKTFFQKFKCGNMHVTNFKIEFDQGGMFSKSELYI